MQIWDDFRRHNLFRVLIAHLLESLQRVWSVSVSEISFSNNLKNHPTPKGYEHRLVNEVEFMARSRMLGNKASSDRVKGLHEATIA